MANKLWLRAQWVTLGMSRRMQPGRQRGGRTCFIGCEAASRIASTSDSQIKGGDRLSSALASVLLVHAKTR